ncbi:hypothetical protein Cyrtocomes_00951 [Candidatus Cyrtobacter comes]|uniref:Uncharacterized protein n=1 Tax=Candidatus Cyrtobacter comes TaxID=675776 RepID=A0ABU5L8X1_9RICK|nr:hypothetical protein [Candidatus Cyrtobacter comes]
MGGIDITLILIKEHKNCKTQNFLILIKSFHDLSHIDGFSPNLN